MENSLKRFEDAKEVLESLQKNGDFSIIEDLLQDNKNEFKHKDKIYRVRLLNRFEKEEVEEMRCRKFGEFIQDKNILLEKDLRENYKNREINIDEIEDKIRKLVSERQSYELKLGESISKKIGESVLKTYDEKIKAIKSEISLLLFQKTNLLEYSLEHRLLIYVTEIVTYFSLEVKNENEEWKRAFLTFEDFRKCLDEELIKKAHAYSIKMHYTL
jgi:hypothetical protein